MNESDLRDLHTFLLITLHGSAQIGMREVDILRRANMATFPTLTAPALATQLRLLANRQFVIWHQPSLDEPRWKILSLGRAALQEAGLA